MKKVVAVVAVSFGALMLLAAQTWAGPIISDNFNTGDDGWSHYAPGSLSQTFSFPANPADGTDAYRMTSDAGVVGNPGRVGSFLAGGSAVADFTITTDLINWNNEMSMNMGVMGRVQTPLPGTTFPLGYALIYTNRASAGGGGSDQLRLYKVISGGLGFMNAGVGLMGQFGTVVGGSAAPNPDGDYQLVFSGFGNLFTGQIIDKSTGLALTFNDGSGGLTDRIIAPDPGVSGGFGALYATGAYGYFGFVGSGSGRAGNGIDFTVDNFSITDEVSVPEPATLGLLSLGLVGIGLVRRRRAA
jgi:hypothetical protein